ncbi:MAG: hypothetical protein K6U80_02350 [Firmicutes bacterium]|nr:hypothetical protein [Bacillota bacterium]
MLKKLEKTMMSITYVYLLLPILLFVAGWLKPPVAIILVLLLIYAGMKAVTSYTPKEYESENSSGKPPAHKIITGLFILLGIIYWVTLSGIGGFSFQNDDFELRNAMLRDLTNFNWPVKYDYPATPNIHDLAGHQGALVYYFVYWLPAALFGKLSGGFEGANSFLFGWSVLGLVLGFYWFSRAVKKTSILLLLLFVFWSGMDAIGWWVQRGSHFGAGEHIEWWSSFFQYSANTTALFWVFNQAVVPWIIVMLLCNQPSKKTVIFTYSLCLPYAPFSFIGLAPFMLYFSVSGKDAEKIFSRKKIINFKALWHNVNAAFSIPNLVAAPVLIGVFLLFFYNTGSRFSNGLIWSPLTGPYNYYGDRTDTLSLLCAYFLFCLFEFGIYVLLIRNKFKKDPVFLITVGSLLLIPSYKMGIYNDFVMRVSIPALTFLMVYVAKFLTAPIYNNRKLLSLKIILVAFLLIGAITPFNEIYRSIDITTHNPQGIINDHWHTLSTLEEFKTGGIGNFVVQDPQNTFFFKYLGK